MCSCWMQLIRNLWDAPKETFNSFISSTIVDETLNPFSQRGEWLATFRLLFWIIWTEKTSQYICRMQKWSTHHLNWSYIIVIIAKKTWIYNTAESAVTKWGKLTSTIAPLVCNLRWQRASGLIRWSASCRFIGFAVAQALVSISTVRFSLHLLGLSATSCNPMAHFTLDSNREYCIWPSFLFSFLNLYTLCQCTCENDGLFLRLCNSTCHCIRCYIGISSMIQFSIISFYSSLQLWA